MRSCTMERSGVSNNILSGKTYILSHVCLGVCSCDTCLYGNSSRNKERDIFSRQEVIPIFGYNLCYDVIGSPYIQSLFCYPRRLHEAGWASGDHGRKEKGAITASGRTPRVLVVDSNGVVCEATSEVVESLGYPATCETESRKALSIFSDNPDEFDLAIIEPRMPELAGVDLAIALRRIRPSFPLLFYAGYLDYPSKQRIEIDCPAPVAIKPMTSHELLEAIEGAFRKSRI